MRLVVERKVLLEQNCLKSNRYKVCPSSSCSLGNLFSDKLRGKH